MGKKMTTDSIVITGGSGSGFLKADGSIDSNAYNAGDTSFAPAIADQATVVLGGGSLYFTPEKTGDNIVQQYGLASGPSWMSMHQINGTLTGSAPSYTDSAADIIVASCKAANALGGITNFLVTVNIGSYASSNTKSLSFNASNGTDLTTSASSFNLFTRDGGESMPMPWTIGMWVYPSSTAGSSTETIFYFGDNPAQGQGAILIEQYNGNNIRLVYGSDFANLTFNCAGNFPLDQWNYVLVSYEGGITGGDDPMGLSNYEDQFNIYVNNVDAVTEITNVAFGYNGSMNDASFFIGKFDGPNEKFFDGIINQIAFWDEDVSISRSIIWNGGVPQDLRTTSVVPTHLYEFQDSVNTISDATGSSNSLEARFFSSSDLVLNSPS